MGIPNFHKADCRLTLLGESVDLLEILCLVRTDGRPTLLEESTADLSYSAESGGILVTFFN